MPLLAGTDGVEKMSKSFDNYIGISESPRDIYGKTLRIPDSMIGTYFELASDVPNAELAEIKKRLGDSATNPRDLKRHLARTFVRMYHNAEEAQKAEAEFDRIFVEKDLPDTIEEFILKPDAGERTIVGLIALTKLASSKGEARRLLEQGGVSIDGDRITDLNAPIPAAKEFILKVGKRKFLKVIHA
jgi:tyrosyl-tRNA synthetase